MYGEGKNQLQKNISCEINQYNFFRLYVQSAQKLHYYWIVILFCVAALVTTYLPVSYFKINIINLCVFKMN